MPSTKWAIILGGALTAITTLTLTYRTLTLLKVPATIVNERPGAEEDCYEFAYEVEGRPYRSWSCNKHYRPYRDGTVVRVDPKSPGEVVSPVASTDMLTTIMMWTLVSGAAWTVVIMYGYVPLYDYVEERRRKRRQEKRRGKKGKQKQP